MTFLNPEYLIGLFALSIPVIIHLFNFRRHKRMYFSDISRLKNITTQTRKQHKLKHIIVLILRLLSLSAIIIALAGPVLPEGKSVRLSDTKTIAVYIDNSFSMMAEGNSGRLFEEARLEALNVVSLSPDNARYILLTNDNKGSLMRLLGKEELISEIESLTITPGTKKLSQIVDVRNRIMSNNNINASDTYLFSDFQSNLFDIESLSNDSSNHYFFIPLDHLNNRNIFIDSLYIDNNEISTGNTIGLNVNITNDSDDDYKKIPLKLTVNNQQKAVAGFDINAGMTTQIPLNFTSGITGWQKGMVEVENYPITFDDKLYFSYYMSTGINVLIVNHDGKNNALKTFYLSDDTFNVSEVNFRSINYGNLYEYDLVILNSIPEISSGLIVQLKEFVYRGGNLLFIPPHYENAHVISTFFKELNLGELKAIDTSDTRVTRLKLSNKLFSGSVKKVPQNAELPNVFKHYQYNFPANSNVETLVSLLSGNDFLSSKKIGAGELFILSVGLDRSYGDFTTQLLFSPIMHGIAAKRGISDKLYYILGKDKNIRIATGSLVPGEKPAILRSLNDGKSLIPFQKYGNNELNIQLENLEINNGFYEVILNDSVISVLAFNYNRTESDMNFYNQEQLFEACSKSGLNYFDILNLSDPNYTEVINELQKDSDFWKLFIIFALFVLLMEILILRYWK